MNRLQGFSMRGVFAAAVLIFTFTSINLYAGQAETIETLRQTSRAFTEVAKKSVDAVVAVQSERTRAGSNPSYNSPFEDDFFDFFFGPRFRQRGPQRESRQGSGFVIRPDGYIMTNNHVIADADKITVTTKDGRKFEAKVIGTDEKSEVAVIKIDAQKLPVIELGDSDSLETGEWVIAVGNPFGLAETITVGVVSAKGRSGFDLTDYEDFIQTDAAINPGNSGGPLLDIDGRAIGINTFIVSQSGGYMGIGFAIPINIAKAVAEQFIRNGKLERGYIGVEIDPQRITPELAESFGLAKPQGAILTRVEPDSPADKAGLKAGDVIVEADGKEIQNIKQVQSIIAFKSPGSKVDLKIIRKGKEKQVTVMVASMAQSTVASETSEVGRKFGLEVQNLTGELAKRFRYPANEGVIISEVKPDSPADIAGIRAGMVILSVNQKYVNSLAEFNEAMAESGKTRKVLLLVRNDRYAQYVALSIQ